MRAAADTAHRSVIYILSNDTEAVDMTAVAAAQQEALRRELPFAVVALVPGGAYSDAAYGTLEALERFINPYQIPLMVCIGESAPVMAALRHHLRPYVYENGAIPDGVELQMHPHAWEGRIQSVAEVRDYAQKVASGETRLCI